MDAPIPETSVPAAGAADPTTAAQPATASQSPAAASQPLAVASQPPASVSASPENPAPAAPRPKSPVRLVLLVALAISGTGSLMLLASAMRVPEGAAVAVNPAPSTPAAGTSPAASTPGAAVVAPAAAGAAVETAAEPVPESAGSAPVPRWAATANPRKAGYGTGMVFELAADGDVEVWRKRVRPVLTVRCAARATEVFVVTDSPAAIEGNSNRHTIALAFDGQDAAEQQWEHSIDHDALFAPNGRALVRQIAAGKTMTFAFAPFNAPPATVTFQIAGFTAQHKAAARICGLETVPTRARR